MRLSGKGTRQRGVTKESGFMEVNEDWTRRGNDFEGPFLEEKPG